MSFYHVVIRIQGQRDRSLFADLSEKDLRSKFVRPYKRGEQLLVDGELINLKLVTSLKIVRTEEPSGDVLKRLQADSQRGSDELNRESSSVVFISMPQGCSPEEVADVGDNVTSQFIDGPPGEAGMRDFFHHPWVLGIGTALVAGLVLWLLGVGQ